jgi:hypothetical protein
VGAAALDDAALGLLQLVLAELDVDRSDDGDGDEGGAGQRLRGLGKGLEIVVEDVAVPVQS